MSLDRPGPAPARTSEEQVRPASEPEADYYQTIEEFFIARRGDPLVLSSADWVLIRKWRRAGIPLRVVLRGIGDALDSHAFSWGRARKVGSLAYCAAEVGFARDRWRRALALGDDEGAETRAFLRGLAESVERARALEPGTRAIAQSVAERLRGLALAPPEGLEEHLRRLEKGMRRALCENDGARTLQDIEAAVEQDLASYRGRMPEGVLAQIRSDAVDRRLFERHGLPRFSLFGI